MSESVRPVAAASDAIDRRSGSDRREWPRVPAEALAELKAQLAAGTEVDLKDLSRGGARFQTESRLLPGLTVAVRLVAVDGRVTTVRGRVMRSRLLKLDRGGMGYEVGIAFQELISPITEEMSERLAPRTAAPASAAPAAPEAGAAPASASTVPSTPAAPPVESAVAASEPPAVMFTAAVGQSTQELRELLSGNEW